LNFTELLETPNKIFESNANYTSIWTKPSHTQILSIINTSWSCLGDKINGFNNLIDALSKHTTVTHTKRQFDIITFGVITTRLTLATFNTIKISKL
jgi:hypothetical protein